MSLGKRILEKRKSLEFTQQQLADVIGLTPQHISAIEQDKRVPSLSSLSKIADELGVSIDYLVTGKDGVVNGLMPAIKADKKLNLKTKKSLIALVEILYLASLHK